MWLANVGALRELIAKPLPTPRHQDRLIVPNESIKAEVLQHTLWIFVGMCIVCQFRELS